MYYASSAYIFAKMQSSALMKPYVWSNDGNASWTVNGHQASRKLARYETDEWQEWYALYTNYFFPWQTTVAGNTDMTNTYWLQIGADGD